MLSPGTHPLNEITKGKIMKSIFLSLLLASVTSYAEMPVYSPMPSPDVKLYHLTTKVELNKLELLECIHSLQDYLSAHSLETQTTALKIFSSSPIRNSITVLAMLTPNMANELSVESCFSSVEPNLDIGPISPSVGKGN